MKESVRNLRRKNADRIRIREFDGYRIVYNGRIRIMELYDENFAIEKIPDIWYSGVTITKYGLTFTPAFIKRLRKQNIDIEVIKTIIMPKNEEE